MQTVNDFYNDENIINNLNTNYSCELAELVDMTFGSKPEPELQRLTTAQITAIDSSGLHLLCNYHRWETAERNDRMFHEHTDETTRIFTIPFQAQPYSKEQLSKVIEKMINDAKLSYLKGFE
ncbi:unnamed protein product [Adineta steineri]|uniref:Uncharacterized protein n=1 Tax=Adineta steineri TaxID=433720 RepID=A0A818JJU5_9BILA|nr:unnamed protein product [Adineta steineri]CAF3537201.1 unnamed protein product [Adineta steineri]